MAFCAEKSAEEDKIALEMWLPELKSAVQEAQRCLDDCKRVRGLVSILVSSFGFMGEYILYMHTEMPAGCFS